MVGEVNSEGKLTHPFIRVKVNPDVWPHGKRSDSQVLNILQLKVQIFLKLF